MKRPSPALLREHLRYDPHTGELWWRLVYHNRPAHKPAGHFTKKGYRKICIFGERFAAHVVIWAIVKGRWPKRQVDHEDRNKANNRWKNLRLATNAQNQTNQTLRASNKSGFKGVSWHKQRRKWVAQCRVKHKVTHLGLFDSPEAAHAAYVATASKQYKEFFHAGN